MGDCRLRFQVASQLFLNRKGSSSDHGAADATKDSSLVTITRVVSADTTIHEAMEGTILPATVSTASIKTILDLVQQLGATVWDCTVYPATNITRQCVEMIEDGDALVGTQKKPESHTKTLYLAGWFPSGSLQILSANATNAVTVTADVYDDRQFNINVNDDRNGGSHANNGNNDNKPRGQVQLVGVSESGAKPLPSQVLHAVTQRFGDTEAQAEAAAAARRQRQLNRTQQQKVEQERAHKLEERIRRLREKEGKKKAVSEQVQRMLIKSRATGRKDLKMEDRVYLHCIFWTDNDDDDDDDVDSAEQDDYRYFSKQDTVGRILASFENLGNKKGLTELLVSANNSQDDSEVDYRRLPVGMRVYEAISASHITGKVDTVVIRQYGSEAGATTSIVEETHADDDDVMTDAAANTDPETPTTATGTIGSNETSSAPVSSSETMTIDSASSLSYARLSEALILLDACDSKKKTKQTNSAAKVRQMQMKSKARGDTKRVKMPDRFFLELVVADDKGFDSVATEACGSVFLAKSDPLDRLLRDCVPPLNDPSLTPWELLVPSLNDSGGSYSFQRIAGSNDDSSSFKSWDDAEQAGKVKSFDRIILRRMQ